jgi:hypothetical protein
VLLQESKVSGLYENLKSSSGRVYKELLLERGNTPGVAISETPDEPGAGQPEVFGGGGVSSWGRCSVTLREGERVAQKTGSRIW